MSELEGWALLHSKLPSQALKPLSESVYGVSGLTDVNEGFLIQRLFASKLPWQWRLLEQRYLGFEDRVSGGGKNYRVYLASAHGILEIEGREFHGAGGHDNRKLDAAFKGAATVAFKNACKLAGLTIELFKDGKAMDFIYDVAEKNPATHEADLQGARAETAFHAAPHRNDPSLVPASSDGQGAGGPAREGTKSGPPPKTPNQILEDARTRTPQAHYADEDAVCPECGRREFLGGNGSFCAKAKGGCGWPKGRGEKGTPISYGQWRERQIA